MSTPRAPKRKQIPSSRDPTSVVAAPPFLPSTSYFDLRQINSRRPSAHHALPAASCNPYDSGADARESHGPCGERALTHQRVLSIPFHRLRLPRPFPIAPPFLRLAAISCFTDSTRLTHALLTAVELSGNDVRFVSPAWPQLQSTSPFLLLLVAMVAYIAVKPCGYCLATVSNMVVWPCESSPRPILSRARRASASPPLGLHIAVLVLPMMESHTPSSGWAVC